MNVQALRHRQHIAWHRPTVEHLAYAPPVSRHVARISASVSGILSLFHVQHAGFIIIALSSGIYLNIFNYWKTKSWNYTSIKSSCDGLLSILFCNLSMESHNVMRFSGIWTIAASCVHWCQVRNEYRFQKAVVKSMLTHSSLDRFLVQTKLTYDGLAGRPTDVRQYEMTLNGLFCADVLLRNYSLRQYERFRFYVVKKIL